MTRPPPHDRRRPRAKDGVNVEVTTNDTPSVTVDTDSARKAARDTAAFAELAVFNAEDTVRYEFCAQLAMSFLDDEDLESLAYIGLSDQGIERVLAELERRGAL